MTKDVKHHRLLHKLVDEIYCQADDHKMSWAALARASGLCATTVSKLGRYVTRFPRAQTVFDLAAATGVRIEISSNGDVGYKPTPKKANRRT